MSRGIAPRFLDLGTRWRWVVSFTSMPLYRQGKSPWYPLYRRLGGPQSRSGRGGEEKNSLSLPGLEPSIIQLVAQRCTTELSCPLYCCIYLDQRSFTRFENDRYKLNPGHVMLRNIYSHHRVLTEAEYEFQITTKTSSKEISDNNIQRVKLMLYSKVITILCGSLSPY
jgi:hypothetical protein